MPSTKKIISDSVLYKLAGGIPTPGFPVHERDVWNALDDKINAKFKLHHFDTTLASGETLPEFSMIATYEGNAVTSLGNGKAVATLPVQPINLPKGVGICYVYDAANPDNFYIPLQRGQLALLKVDTLLNDLNGQIGYEPKKNTIVFTKDITQFGVTEVTMELAVFDISQYTTTQDLPIPADMVDEIEDELIKEFAPVLAKSGFVSNFTNPSQNIPK